MNLNAFCVSVVLLFSSSFVWAEGVKGHLSTSCEPGAKSIVPQELLRESGKIVCGAVAVTPTEITSIIERALAKHTHALKRKVVLYHYGKNPVKQSGPVDPKDSALAERFFYDPSFGRSFYDNKHVYQLYAANNPLVSLDYSFSPPLLLKIGVPAGIRYLGGGLLEFSPEDAAKLRCFLERITFPNYEGRAVNAALKYPSGLIVALRRSAMTEGVDILKTVIKKLKIQLLVDDFRRNIMPECPGANPQIKFIDPSLSPLLEKTLLSPNLESNPSPEKLETYKDLLRWFNVVDAAEVTAIQNSVEPKFWEYYKALAPIVYHLPPGTDLAKFQKEQSQKLKDERSKLIESSFGCSNDPAFHDEILDD